MKRPKKTNYWKETPEKGDSEPDFRKKRNEKAGSENRPERKRKETPGHEERPVHKRKPASREEEVPERREFRTKPSYRPGPDRESSRYKGDKKSGKKDDKKPGKKNVMPMDQPVRLNRYISQSGVCSRREADKLIEAGHITVNGQVITTLGVKVDPQKDVIAYKGKNLHAEPLVYILLNKPKNTITTTDDPHGRRTVINAIQDATPVKVYPVGRLDRNTTGLLLLTNDGDLAKKMTHPSHKVRKLYHVRLDKAVEERDLYSLTKGVELEDGLAKADKADYVMGKPQNEVGIEIHIGRNRVVRRMFEAMGYTVEALDRVSIAHLTKKNLPRGKWRELSQEEVNFLKMI
jgi:23S rRNA pseudouridine2605 synthase